MEEFFREGGSGMTERTQKSGIENVGGRAGGGNRVVSRIGEESGLGQGGLGNVGRVGS